MTETLYDLYDGMHHTIRLEGVTLERIQQWYDDHYGLGPGAVDVVPASSGSYFTETSYYIFNKKNGKEVGYMAISGTSVESDLHIPEETEFIHNPSYVPPEIKNIKGKAQKGT
jgi:hypothetical protein